MPFPRRISRAAYLLTVGAAAAGCATPATPDDLSAAGAAAIAAGTVHVSTSNGAIVVRNDTDRAIGISAFERETAGVVLWKPCLPGPTVRCAGLAGGDTQRIAYQDITGYQPGKKEAIVYYWNVETNPANGESKIENMRSVVVQLDR